MYDHKKTPVFTAMKAYLERQVTPFDVPGHKHGRGLKEYTDFFGERMMGLDVNWVCQVIGVNFFNLFILTKL